MLHTIYNSEKLLSFLNLISDNGTVDVVLFYNKTDDWLSLVNIVREKFSHLLNLVNLNEDCDVRYYIIPTGFDICSLEMQDVTLVLKDEYLYSNSFRKEVELGFDGSVGEHTKKKLTKVFKDYLRYLEIDRYKVDEEVKLS